MSSQRQKDTDGTASPVVDTGISIGKRPALLQDRTEGLQRNARRTLQTVGELIELRHLDEADQALAKIQASAGKHPEFLRLSGITRHLQTRNLEAIQLLRRALAARPNDALLYTNLGSVLKATGDVDGAIAAFMHANDLDPGLAAPWFNLGKVLAKQPRVTEAMDALDHALRRDPEHVGARITRAELLAAVGRIDESAAEYRRVLARKFGVIDAWTGLTNLKTVELTDAEVATLERVHAAPQLTASDRARIGFALGKAMEDKKRYVEAFAVFSAANSVRRREVQWNSAEFSRGIDLVTATFRGDRAHASDPELGKEIIFIVGMPSSGSTLVEHILSVHEDVEGAGELPDLSRIIEEESKRLNRAFPDWAATATANDWKRLGRMYLERTAHLRKQHPRSTDKGRLNWTLIGAAHAMLPGARFVNCRRDPVETCWSCFKQDFSRGQAYSHEFVDLAAQWHDYDRLTRFWQSRYPHRIHDLVYEELLVAPEAEVRRLLAFCDLAFNEACLRLTESERNERTVSAGQARQALSNDTALSAAYGELLYPLRAALGIASQP